MPLSQGHKICSRRHSLLSCWWISKNFLSSFRVCVICTPSSSRLLCPSIWMRGLLLSPPYQLNVALTLRTNPRYFHPIPWDPTKISQWEHELGKSKPYFSHHMPLFASNTCHQLFCGALLLIPMFCFSGDHILWDCLCILWSPTFLFQLSDFALGCSNFVVESSKTSN